MFKGVSREVFCILTHIETNGENLMCFVFKGTWYTSCDIHKADIMWRISFLYLFLALVQVRLRIQLIL